MKKKEKLKRVTKLNLDAKLCSHRENELFTMINSQAVSGELEEFHYVIAKIWENTDDHLCNYAYGREVFRGTIEDARAMREFIRERANDNGKYDSSYNIYPINRNFIE